MAFLTTSETAEQVRIGSADPAPPLVRSPGTGDRPSGMAGRRL